MWSHSRRLGDGEDVKLCVIRRDSTTVAARLEGDRLIALERQTSELLGVPASPAAGENDVGSLEAAEIQAPLRPGKIVAIGLNYRDHIAEAKLEEPATPLVFAKFPSSVIGPGASIEIHRELTKRVDWEVELGVVIGRRMRWVAESEALDHVLGYTVANDVSARDVQFSDGQWTRGKSFDTFCPVGPWIVTRDEIPDPQNLTLTTRINGEIMQQGTTNDMVFSVAEILTFCSRSFTLEPGDLVLTGTPWGCGEFMDPPRSLANGDEVEVEIEGIGCLRNPVVVWEAP